jgi:hypothetical protein
MIAWWTPNQTNNFTPTVASHGSTNTTCAGAKGLGIVLTLAPNDCFCVSLNKESIVYPLYYVYTHLFVMRVSTTYIVQLGYLFIQSGVYAVLLNHILCIPAAICSDRHRRAALGSTVATCAIRNTLSTALHIHSWPRTSVAWLDCCVSLHHNIINPNSQSIRETHPCCKKSKWGIRHWWQYICRSTTQLQPGVKQTAACNTTYTPLQR